MEASMESCLNQVLQKDVGRRLQVGQEIIDYISDKDKSSDLEHDQTNLDKLVDGIATSWVNSSNFKDVVGTSDPQLLVANVTTRAQAKRQAQKVALSDTWFATTSPKEGMPPSCDLLGGDPSVPEEVVYGKVMGLEDESKTTGPYTSERKVSDRNYILVLSWSRTWRSPVKATCAGG
ncbi:unnamed protein product [Lota lota]